MQVILLRFDCCAEIGMGHFARCHTLLRELQKHARTKVVCCCSDSELIRELLASDDAAIEWKADRESECNFLIRCIVKYSADCLFVDSLRGFEEEEVAGFTLLTRVVFFHNISRGAKYSDAVILPVAHVAEIIKEEFVQAKAEFFHGFDFFFPRDSVRKLKTSTVADPRPLGEIAISAGGTDPRGISEHLLNVLRPIAFGVPITLHVGEGVDQGRFDALSKSSESMRNVTVKRFSLQEIAQSTLVVSVFGVTSYELIYLNVPVLGLGLSTANGEACMRLARDYGVIDFAGNWWETTAESLAASINELLKPKALAKMKKAQYGKIDENALSRVINVIHGEL
jgi:spore coat polysaccharide biosynthesis predicted glycosyltransferase SpsG